MVMQAMKRMETEAPLPVALWGRSPLSISGTSQRPYQNCIVMQAMIRLRIGGLLASFLGYALALFRFRGLATSQRPYQGSMVMQAMNRLKTEGFFAGFSGGALVFCLSGLALRAL